jgi:hypothetical protein
MSGSKPSGEAVSKCAVDLEYKGLLAEDEARDLRIRLHAGMEDAGYTKAQIAQVTNWSGRTIRRDLQDNPDVRPIARIMPKNEAHDTARTKPTAGLSQRDVNDLKSEYNYSPTIMEFLERVEKSRASA